MQRLTMYTAEHHDAEIVHGSLWYIHRTIETTKSTYELSSMEVNI